MTIPLAVFKYLKRENQLKGKDIYLKSYEEEAFK